MKLTWLNKKGVESENGEVVQFTGQSTAEYRKGDEVIEVGVEDGFAGGEISVRYKRKDFEKWSWGGRLSPSQKEQAINTFREALQFQGLVPDEE